MYGKSSLFSSFRLTRHLIWCNVTVNCFHLAELIRFSTTYKTDCAAAMKSAQPKLSVLRKR